MPVKSLACTECHMIIDVQVGNLGWWLKSNNELKAKNKKDLQFWHLRLPMVANQMKRSVRLGRRKTRMISSGSRYQNQNALAVLMPNLALIGRA